MYIFIRLGNQIMPLNSMPPPGGPWTPDSESQDYDLRPHIRND